MKFLAAVIFIPAFLLGGAVQERDRAKVDEKYKWNLADIYSSEAAWEAAKVKVAAEIPAVAQYQGRLLSSAATLSDAMEKLFAVSKDLNRLGTYSSLLADEDTRNSRHQAMRLEIGQMRSTLSTQSAYIAPEILRGDRATLERFLTTEPRLKDYRFYLEEILRGAPHILGEKEEKILASSGQVANGPASAYAIFVNAEFPYPTVTLSDGKAARLDQSAFADLRALPNRKDRETVMSAFFTSLGAFNGTFGTLINGEVQKMLFYSRSRNYPSSMEMALDGPNIPVAVYQHLIDGVNKSLPTFHRYLKLRQRMLGVDQLHYYDLYAPLVPSLKLDYTPEEAQKHVLAALAPLGTEYTTTLQRAFTEHWIDLLPSDGKRSGGYMNGSAYDVHPYLLLNFNGKYIDVSTLAHELGHAMHSYYSNKTQPYPLSGYEIFVAEVASTLNESLLSDYMLKNIQSPEARLSLLGNYVESIKGTVFRQVQFAEFEMRLHEMAQKGQPIVGSAVDKLFMDITRKYYGHDQGICIVDDYVAHEWSYIPHFYSEFYVYQYATSFTASEALAVKVKSGDAAATKRYLTFLTTGGSKYPVDLLKDAGVDMTTDEPLNLTIQSMNRAMDEMERLLAAR
ncbi:MAG TPA: oligoendopeptidase F [Terriglobia bacterium]|nr:oligoendopeptidase F [Terriglobia bacterium]